MSAPDRRRYTVRDKQSAQWIGSLVAELEPGWSVAISPPGRTLDQNAIFHAMCDELAKAMPVYHGLSMDASDWKALLIVSHDGADAAADGKKRIRLVPDLEGNGLVQLRESSARMSKTRATSLIEYVLKVGAENSVTFSAPESEYAGR